MSSRSSDDEDDRHDGHDDGHGQQQHGTLIRRRRRVTFGNPALGTYGGYADTLSYPSDVEVDDDDDAPIVGPEQIRRERQRRRRTTEEEERDTEEMCRRLAAMIAVPPEQVPDGVLNLVRSYRPDIEHIRIVITDDKDDDENDGDDDDINRELRPSSSAQELLGLGVGHFGGLHRGRRRSASHSDFEFSWGRSPRGTISMAMPHPPPPPASSVSAGAAHHHSAFQSNNNSSGGGGAPEGGSPGFGMRFRSNSTTSLPAGAVASAMEGAASILAADEEAEAWRALERERTLLENKRRQNHDDHHQLHGEEEEKDDGDGNFIDEGYDDDDEEDEKSMTYLVLILLSSPEAADRFVSDLDGRPYTSLQRDVTCSVMHVATIRGDDGVSLMSPFFAASSSPASAAHHHHHHRSGAVGLRHHPMGAVSASTAAALHKNFASTAAAAARAAIHHHHHERGLTTSSHHLGASADAASTTVPSAPAPPPPPPPLSSEPTANTPMRSRRARSPLTLGGGGRLAGGQHGGGHPQLHPNIPAEVLNCAVCLERMDMTPGSGAGGGGGGSGIANANGGRGSSEINNDATETAAAAPPPELPGIITTVCNHTFHIDCLLRWQDSPCPVCRYDHSGLNEALSQCHVCGTTENNYVCLICGVVSCGESRANSGGGDDMDLLAAGDLDHHHHHHGDNYSSAQGCGDSCRSCANGAGEVVAGHSRGPDIERQGHRQQWAHHAGQSGSGADLELGRRQRNPCPSGHARQHYDETLHAYALDTETQHVWDFAGRGYVHRLIQNKDDGKLVEVTDPANTTSHERSLSPGLSDAQEGEFVHRKLEGFAGQYYTLLKSQLEQQRIYYEAQLEEIRREHSARRGGGGRSTHDLISALKQERNQLEQRCKTLGRKCQKVSDDVAFLKSMNESLRANKEPMRRQIMLAQAERAETRDMILTRLPPLEEKVAALIAQLEGCVSVMDVDGKLDDRKPAARR